MHTNFGGVVGVTAAFLPLLLRSPQRACVLSWAQALAPFLYCKGMPHIPF